MRVIVTGGAGFIGSHIVDCLISNSHIVKVIDNFSEGKKENLELALQHSKQFREEYHLKIIEGDVRDYDLLLKEFENYQCVLHQAALRSVPKSVENPESFEDNNIKGTRNVLEAAKNTGVRRFVFASSSSVYGMEEQIPQVEGREGTRISPYAISKYTGEDYCKMYHHLHGLETIALRYFNVFGPKQKLESKYAVVIPAFITRLLNGKPPIIYGDGEQTRDFTYVENVVEANINSMFAAKGIGEVFNIANKESISVNELAKKINELLGTNIAPVYEDPRQGDVKHTLAENEKAKKLLSYKGRVSFDEGLRRTVEWFLRKRMHNCHY